VNKCSPKPVKIAISAPLATKISLRLPFMETSNRVGTLLIDWLCNRLALGAGKVAPNGERRKLANEQAGESQASSVSTI
jgi:hypothetical protein